MRYAVTFLEGAGVDAPTLAALRRASSRLRALPVGTLRDVLREMPSLVVDVDDDESEAHVLALQSLELHVEPDVPRSSWRVGRSTESLLGLGPPSTDEHRWTYEPSFHPPLIVSAFAAGDVWRVHAQWAEITRDEPRLVHGVRLETAPRIALRVGTGQATALLARRAFALLAAAEKRSAPDPHTAWADGARVEMGRPAVRARETITAHSSEPRASGLAFSGLLLASCIEDARLEVLRNEISRYFA